MNRIQSKPHSFADRIAEEKRRLEARSRGKNPAPPATVWSGSFASLTWPPISTSGWRPPASIRRGEAWLKVLRS
jgi:hypothetical protein